MNVLVISRMFPDSLQPLNGIFVKEQIERMSKGARFTVLSPRSILHTPLLFKLRGARGMTPAGASPSKTSPRHDGIDVVYPCMPPVFLLRPLYGVLFTLSVLVSYVFLRRRFSPDIIHAHTAFPDGFAACVLGTLVRKPVLITEHTGPFETLLERCSDRWATRFALRRCAHIIAVSAFLADRIREEGIPDHKISIIPNGFDEALFHPADAPPSMSRRKVLFVGWLVEIKGLQYLIRAVRLLKDRNQDVALDIIGDGPLAGSLSALSGELGVAPNIRFLGARSRQEIAEAIRSADVLVLPSLYETFGVVLIEAMACGIPVVATACGGPADIVTPETGMLVAPGDPEQLVNALVEVFTRRTDFDPLRIATRARERFSYAVITKKVLALYERIVSEFPPRNDDANGSADGPNQR